MDIGCIGSYHGRMCGVNENKEVTNRQQNTYIYRSIYIYVISEESTNY